MDGQDGMTRAIVAVELLCSEKIIDFKDTSQPTLAQVSQLFQSICFSLHRQISETFSTALSSLLALSGELMSRGKRLLE